MERVDAHITLHSLNGFILEGEAFDFIHGCENASEEKRNMRRTDGVRPVNR